VLITDYTPGSDLLDKDSSWVFRASNCSSKNNWRYKKDITPEYKEEIAVQAVWLMMYYEEYGHFPGDHLNKTMGEMLAKLA